MKMLKTLRQCYNPNEAEEGGKEQGGRRQKLLKDSSQSAEAKSHALEFVSTI